MEIDLFRLMFHRVRWFLLITLLMILSVGGSCFGFHIHPETLRFDQSVLNLGTTTYGAFLQDRDGFLWFGSMGSGLLRYDGYELKKYKTGPGFVSGSMISTIVEDRDGVLWIATFSEGVTQYDKKTGVFTHHKHNPENSNSIGSNSIPIAVRTLYVDHNNTLWVALNNQGLDRYDIKSNQWTHYRHDPKNPNSLSHNTVTSITGDSEGILWVGTKEGGLNRFDPKKGKWTHYQHDPNDPATLSENWVQVTFVDRRGVLWVGTKGSGLNRFDQKNETFTHFQQENRTGALGNNDIWNLFEDRAGNFWIAHYVGNPVALERFDREKEFFFHYKYDPKNHHGISSEGVAGIYEDEKTGILWILNINGVIDKYDKRNQRFHIWKNEPNNPNSLKANEVLSIFEDSQGVIWVGTIKGGLNRLDRKTETFTHYLPNPKDPTSIPSIKVNVIYEDSSDNFWVATWGGDLCLFDRKKGKCEKIYRNDPKNPSSITKSQWIQDIIEDREDPNILWIGGFQAQLDRFDKKEERFSHFKHDPTDPESLSINMITKIHDEGKGKLWITTYGGGLNLFDKKTGKFKHYKHNPNDPDNSINSNTLYEIYRDSRGIFWIGGKGGLSRFDEKSGQFKNYTKETGFPSNVIDNILEDQNGNLWLGSVNSGIIKFNPKDETFQVFTEDDGVASNTLFLISRLKSRDGKLWFGGAKGLTSFDPEKIVNNPYIPPIFLTSFKQGGNELNLGMAPEKVQEVVLRWPNNFFEFQFAALNHTNPKENHYAYMLEGWDTDWYYAGTNPFGRYSKLTGGEYTLRLKGSNNDGLWNEQGAAVKITVISPLWERWWFYGLLVLMAIIINLFILYYLAKLKHEIKERKRTEKILQDSQEKYERLVELSPNLVLTYSKRGVIDFINSSGVKILGGTNPENIIGSSITHFISPSEKKRFIEATTRSFDTFKSVFIKDEPFVTMDGVPVWVDVSVIPFTLHDKPSMLLIAQDVSERKKSEEEKASLESQLFQAQKMEAVGTLAGGIAHDFNNILQGIFMSIQLIRTKIPENSTARKFLDRAFALSVRGAELVKQILTFSRRAEQEISNIEIAPIVKEVIKMMRSVLPANIKIEESISDHCGNIQGNLTQIHQVVMNLCTNAGYSMRENGGVLSISMAPVFFKEGSDNVLSLASGKYLKLTVRDTGTGIAPDVLEHIFEPFFTTKPKEEGTGLGLSVVHGIILDHHGSISVESELGKGTSFEVLFPVIQCEKQAVEENSNHNITGAERILLIDDEELILEVEKEVLEELGYRVTAVQSGEQALDIFRANPEQFDMILTDQTMPGMTGDQLAKTLLNEFPNFPLVLMTGYSYVINKETMKEIGVREIINKPFGGDRIGPLIRKIFDQTQ